MKKILLSVAIVILVAGAVIADSGVTEHKQVCPNRPGCICTKQAIQAPAATAKKDICPNHPGCICN